MKKALWILTVLACLFPLLSFADFIAEIKAKAAKEWPGDYTMQKFVIERQTKAAKKVGEYHEKYKNGPKAIHQILLKAAKEWPDDYAMMIFVFERQLKAYRELHQ